MNFNDFIVSCNVWYVFFCYQLCSIFVIVVGDIVDNDCDGWIDEEENNGIGNVIICNVINIV